MPDNLSEFLTATERIEAELPRIHRDAQVALFVAGYRVAIDRTPVRTGALRAEHVVLHDGRIQYEAPSRPGPEARVSVVGGVLEPPSPGDAKAALAEVAPFGHIEDLNQRFYASFVHDGTATMAPRPFMDLARDHVERLVTGLRIDDQRLR